MDPKPITLESVSEEDYAGSFDPQPYIVVGGVQVSAAQVIDALRTLPGYDEDEQQFLANDTSELRWVQGP